VSTGQVLIDKLLTTVIQLKASDIHISVGQPPVIRLHGRMRKLDAKVLDSDDTTALMKSITPDRCQQELQEKGGADFAIEFTDGVRFRCAIFKQKGTIGMVLRRIPNAFLTFEQIGMPDAVRSLIVQPRGLLLVTGPTGSGKTTTLAAMIDRINAMREVHVVTIEDPIEVLHEDKLAMINQREVGLDTSGFSGALRAAMRQDPDVILVGEMRDEETVRAALSAAETGHFVMSTLHTTDAQETVNRIVDFFPPHEQQQVRVALAGALRGIVAQRLVRRADGLGRCCVAEVCVATGRIAEAIVDPTKTSMITELVSQGGYYGMQTFDQHLVALVRDGVVTVDDAAAVASKPHDLSVELRRLGLVA